MGSAAIVTTVALGAGFVLVGLVVVRCVVACLDAVQRSRARRETRVLDLERLRAAVGREALSFWERKEQADLSWSGLRKFHVKEIVRDENEDGDIASFYLVPHDQRPLPLYRPGQFLTFEVRVPGQPRRVIRCYSLSDAPRRDRYRVTIKRVPDGLVSGWFHDALQPGDIVDVKAPAGNFCLDTEEEEDPVVLVAGGVGVTPMLSMFNTIADRQPQREVWFLYAARTGSALIHRDHLEAQVEKCPNARLLLVLSSPTDEDEETLGGPLEGERRVGFASGRVSGELLREILPSGAAGTHTFYTCGPPPMMSAVVEALEEWGVSDDRIRYEAFGPASIKRKASRDAPAAEPAASCDVKFAKSDKVVAWDPGAENLFALAESNGVSIECNCLAGNCGTCEIAVLEGEFDYPQKPSYDAAPGTCLACMAIPRTHITLDA